jgi:nucleoside-triphosphatase THEP1
VAAIIYPPAHAIDGLLRTLADRLAARGWRIGGVIQTRQADDGCAGMLLEDIKSGTKRSIAQNLGKLSTSCKLDSSVMADIAGDLERQIDAGLDLLVINRFGKLEFDGGGLRSVIERAIIAGTPVLTGVRDINSEAWAGFHGGLGASLPPDAAAAIAWAESLLEQSRQI